MSIWAKWPPGIGKTQIHYQAARPMFNYRIHILFSNWYIYISIMRMYIGGIRLTISLHPWRKALKTGII